MATVALRLGRLSTRIPNSGFGTGSAPDPSAPPAMSRAPVSPMSRAVRDGSRGARSGARTIASSTPGEAT